MNTKSQVVVITGASAGVGRATVCAFAKRGAHIGLLARGPEGLDGARKEAEACGGRAIALPTDVADAAAVGSAADAVEEKFGPIDIWINNAMTSVFAPVTEIKPAEFKRVTEVTYLGVVYGTMEALKRMWPRNHGTIIQVGSALAYRSIPLQSAYCGSKHAIVGFTDSLRCELIHEGSKIKLTVVHMPALNTPQFGWVKSRLPHKAQPVPPIFQPEVAAEAIRWAADHPRRELWVGASTYQAILGQRFVPRLLDLYLGKTGYQAQQHDGPADPNSPDDLWEPVTGDPGAHGSFDDRAHSQSWALKLTQYRGWLAAVGIILGSVVSAFLQEGKGAKRSRSTRMP
jgi:NAD(P)-dependent dehydrogenase (short-subunit alcohol dehydrogenase family)